MMGAFCVVLVLALAWGCTSEPVVVEPAGPFDAWRALSADAVEQGLMAEDGGESPFGVVQVGFEQTIPHPELELATTRDDD